MTPRKSRLARKRLRWIERNITRVPVGQIARLSREQIRLMVELAKSFRDVREEDKPPDRVRQKMTVATKVGRKTESGI